jgi:hypothetical protein
MSFLTPLWDHDVSDHDRYVGVNGYEKSLFYVSDEKWATDLISFDKADMTFD